MCATSLHHWNLFKMPTVFFCNYRKDFFFFHFHLHFQGLYSRSHWKNVGVFFQADEPELKMLTHKSFISIQYELNCQTHSSKNYITN